MLTTRRFSLRSITDTLIGLDDDELEKAFLQAYHNRESQSFYQRIDPFNITPKDVNELQDIALALLRAAYSSNGEFDGRYYSQRNILLLFINETAYWFLSDPSFITAMCAFVDVACCYDSIFITYDGRNLLEDKRDTTSKALRKSNYFRSRIRR